MTTAGLAFLLGLVETATDLGGRAFALVTPHGLWAAIRYGTLLITLALAVSMPLARLPQRTPDNTFSVA